MEKGHSGFHVTKCGCNFIGHSGNGMKMYFPPPSKWVFKGPNNLGDGAGGLHFPLSTPLSGERLLS